MNSDIIRIIVYDKSNSFYNRLIKNNIYYKDLIKAKEYYILTINESDYKKLNKRYECKIIRYYGKKFIINFFYVHKYMLISFIISLLLLFMLANTIFDIQINSKDENIINILNHSLEEFDISLYKRKKSFREIENIKKKILDNNKDTLEWIEIKNKGCKYVIDITPRVKNEKNILDDEPTDIIATKDGKILFITSNSGTVIKEKNDYVKKGDILVSGNIFKDDKIIYQVKSEGKVYAEVWYTVKVTIPYNYVEYIEVGKPINRYYLDVFGKEFTLIGKYNGKNTMRNKMLVLDKPYLPFKIYKETINRYEYREFHITEQEAYNEAIKRSNHNIEKMLSDDEHVISKKVLKKEVFSSKIIVEVFYKVYENIGATSKIINKDT